MPKEINDEVGEKLADAGTKLDMLGKGLYESRPKAAEVIRKILHDNVGAESLITGIAISTALSTVNYLEQTAEHGYAPEHIVTAMREAVEIMKLSIVIIETLEEIMTPVEVNAATLHEPNGSMQ